MVSKKLTVLIVDDSKLMIDKIIELLDNCEVIGKIYSSLTYSNAIGLIDSKRPDVALLDINLQDRSGIDILSYIRENNAEMKVIMFTNNVSNYHKEQCLKIGADHFIDKSQDFDILSLLIVGLAKQSYHVRPI